MVKMLPANLTAVYPKSDTWVAKQSSLAILPATTRSLPGCKSVMSGRKYQDTRLQHIDQKSAPHQADSKTIPSQFKSKLYQLKHQITTGDIIPTYANPT